LALDRKEGRLATGLLTAYCSLKRHTHTYIYIYILCMILSEGTRHRKKVESMSSPSITCFVNVYVPHSIGKE
jgi:hypothetical protein